MSIARCSRSSAEWSSARSRVGFWAFFAPTKVGGSTTYSVTSGISMEPMLHKNDLEFVRTQSTYHVGDVVLYQSAVVDQPVLHRIILIQHGNYFFQGDNNSFVDPGYATKSELVGTLWFHVPRSAPGSAGSVHRRTRRCSQESRSCHHRRSTGSTTKRRRRPRRGRR